MAAQRTLDLRRVDTAPSGHGRARVRDAAGRIASGTWAGAAFVLLLAVLLFTRFSVDDPLGRDEAIYTYGGQQMAHGVPPYQAIFDPKTPLAQMLCGLGAFAARVLAVDDLHAIRILFFLLACASVVCVYLLALALFESRLAAIVGAAVFASFKGFAFDALGGPDAKTPGVLFGVLAMLLLVHRRWFWGAFAGSLAFLVWQPLGAYVLVALAGAWLSGPAERRRALVGAVAGAAAPIAATTLYFALAGALPQLVEAAIRFPLTGMVRGHETLTDRLWHIEQTVGRHYGRFPVWAGLIALVVLVVVRHVAGGRSLRRTVEDPLVWAVTGSLVPLAVFPLTDFQGYPDVYPLLPYAAIGIAGAVALVTRSARDPRVRRGAAAVAVMAAAVVVGKSFIQFPKVGRGTSLPAQRAAMARIAAELGPHGRLWAFGDPTPLVLLHRRNPSRFIYLGSGVSRWHVVHTPGRFDGWRAQVRRFDPDVVVTRTWSGGYYDRMTAWLERRLAISFVGDWRLLVKVR